MAKSTKDNCSNHKKEVAGISDMKVLAELIGDLHYETLENLLGQLSIKLYKDGLSDRMNGREKLGYTLDDAANFIRSAALKINTAWEISNPHMEANK
jgi:hypothetical protein